MSLKNMTINSAITASVSLFRLCSQFFVLPFLARHLGPEDYGVIALAMPFILFSIMFARSGIETPLLREKERDPLIWSSSFWFVSLSGLAFTLAIVAISPIAAWFFETPQLFPILGWMSLGILLQALSIVPMAMLRHDKRFKILSFAQMLSLLLGLFTAVYIAAKGGGAWAIVIQGFVIHGSLLLFVLIASKFKPKLFLNYQMIKGHLKFGYAVVGATFLEFLKNSLRSLVIAKVLGVALLGFYSLAFLFLNLPYRMINMVLRDVVYTYLAPLREDKALMRSMFLLIIRCLSVFVFPVMGILAAAHDPAFHIILSETWSLSGTLYMIAAPAFALASVMSVRIVFLQILGEVKLNFRCGIEIVILQLAILMLFVWQGIEWAMAGFALSMLIYIPRELMVLRTHLECPVIDILKTIVPSAIITALGAGIYFAAISWFGIDNILMQFLTALLVGLLTLLATIGAQYKTVRSDFKNLSLSLNQ